MTSYLIATTMSDVSPLDHEGIRVAIEQARKSYSEGGIPIGGALIASPSQEILGSGHNQRIQKASPILHGETAALENAGRLQADVYRHATMVCRTAVQTCCT
jgi:creatinine deaminase